MFGAPAHCQLVLQNVIFKWLFLSTHQRGKDRSDSCWARRKSQPKSSSLQWTYHKINHQCYSQIFKWSHQKWDFKSFFTSKEAQVSRKWRFNMLSPKAGRQLAAFPLVSAGIAPKAKLASCKEDGHRAQVHSGGPVCRMGSALESSRGCPPELRPATGSAGHPLLPDDSVCMENINGLCSVSETVLFSFLFFQRDSQIWTKQKRCKLHLPDFFIMPHSAKYSPQKILWLQLVLLRDLISRSLTSDRHSNHWIQEALTGGSCKSSPMMDRTATWEKLASVSYDRLGARIFLDATSTIIQTWGTRGHNSLQLSAMTLRELLPSKGF